MAKDSTGAKDKVADVASAIDKERRRLEGRLDAARKDQAKRVRQLASAEKTKGKKQVAKRRRQVEDATRKVAALT